MSQPGFWHNTSTSSAPAGRSAMPDKHRILILGGGFGGLVAARTLKRTNAQITLMDKRNFHLFQPLLYQVATGSLSPGEIAAPLRSVLSRQKNTQVLLGEAVDIDPAKKLVHLRDAAEYPYGTLIISTGSQTSYYGKDTWREAAPSLKTLEEATAIRHKLLYAFERAERSSDPAEIARETLRNDFRRIRPEEARILLMEGGNRVLNTYPEDLSAKAESL